MNFKGVFRDLILERQLEDLGAYVRRAKPYTVMPKKALAVIGIRRCGKTTYLKQIWDDLKEAQHVTSQQLVYTNFFDERLFGLTASQLGQLIEAYDELHPDRPPNTVIHFFLDEIQVINGWELFVDRLIRSRNHKVYISGSSATLLSKEVSSAMRGRSLSVELFPFDFSEVLNAGSVETQALSPRKRARVIARFRDYLTKGGFPEVLNVDPLTRRQVLQEYLNVVLLKDIIERHNPSDPLAVSTALRFLLNQVGSLYTINKTCERLRATGLKVTKTEISKFIEWYHDSYLLFSVPIFSNSISRQTVNPRKIYCIDTGFAYHVSQSVSENIGHLLENAIFLKIRRQTEMIFYYKDRRNREVDFAFKNKRGTLQLIQVCADLSDDSVRQREVEALKSAMKELNLKVGLIVTMNDEEEIKFESRKIHILPGWKFLLEEVKINGA
jgi:hypothetical protein